MNNVHQVVAGNVQNYTNFLFEFLLHDTNLNIFSTITEKKIPLWKDTLFNFIFFGVACQSFNSNV